MTLGPFLDALATLDWDSSVEAHRDVEGLLLKLVQSPAAVRSEVREWRLEGLEERASRSHETSTHYKWFVGGCFTGSFTVWLHQYKLPSRIRPGYASVPHDHRYWFSSGLLRGGFRHVDYSYEPERTPRLRRETVVDLRVGDAYTLSPDRIHAIEDLLDATLTIVVQGNPIRNFSTAYDLATGGVVRYPDFPGQLRSLEEAVEPFGDHDR